MEEIWKDIKGQEGVYKESNLGRVLSCDRHIEIHYKNGKTIYYHLKERFLNINKNNKGYCVVNLTYNRKTKHKLIHRLVAESFIPNPNNLPEINHKDENKSNNRVDNLEWCTRKQNNNYGIQSKDGRRTTSKLRMKKVAQYNDKGELIQILDGIRLAEEKTGVDNRNIVTSCKNKNRKAGGFKWKYYVDED